MFRVVPLGDLALDLEVRPCAGLGGLSLRLDDDNLVVAGGNRVERPGGFGARRVKGYFVHFDSPFCSVYFSISPVAVGWVADRTFGDAARDELLRRRVRPHVLGHYFDGFKLLGGHDRLGLRGHEVDELLARPPIRKARGFVDGSVSHRELPVLFAKNFRLTQRGWHPIVALVHVYRGETPFRQF